MFDIVVSHPNKSSVLSNVQVVILWPQFTRKNNVKKNVKKIVKENVKKNVKSIVRKGGHF